MPDKKMVSIYELITKLSKSENFDLLLKSGIVPVQYLDYKIIYEHYCKEKAKGIRHADAIIYTADEFGCSESYIWKIKYKLESVIA